MPTLPNPRNQGRHTPQCTQFAFQNFLLQLNLLCYYSRGSDQHKEITDSAEYNKIRPQIPSETVNNLLSANQASSRYMFCCRHSLLDTWMHLFVVRCKFLSSNTTKRSIGRAHLMWELRNRKVWCKNAVAPTVHKNQTQLKE